MQELVSTRFIVEPMSLVLHEAASPVLNGSMFDGDADDASPLLFEGLVTGTSVFMLLLQSLVGLKNGLLLHELLLHA
jgi:hypothetical protein